MRKKLSVLLMVILLFANVGIVRAGENVQYKTGELFSVISSDEVPGMNIQNEHPDLLEYMYQLRDNGQTKYFFKAKKDITNVNFQTIESTVKEEAKRTHKSQFVNPGTGVGGLQHFKDYEFGKIIFGNDITTLRVDTNINLPSGNKPQSITIVDDFQKYGFERAIPTSEEITQLKKLEDGNGSIELSSGVKLEIIPRGVDKQGYTTSETEALKDLDFDITVDNGVVFFKFNNINNLPDIVAIEVNIRGIEATDKALSNIMTVLYDGEALIRTGMIDAEKSELTPTEPVKPVEPDTPVEPDLPMCPPCPDNSEKIKELEKENKEKDDLIKEQEDKIKELEKEIIEKDKIITELESRKPIYITEVQIKEVVKEVIKEKPIYITEVQIKEVIKEVEKEVEVEKPIYITEVKILTNEVIKEVIKEKEVVKEVGVEKPSNNSSYVNISDKNSGKTLPATGDGGYIKVIMLGVILVVAGVFVNKSNK